MQSLHIAFSEISWRKQVRIPSFQFPGARCKTVVFSRREALTSHYVGTNILVRGPNRERTGKEIRRDPQPNRHVTDAPRTPYLFCRRSGKGGSSLMTNFVRLSVLAIM